MESIHWYGNTKRVDFDIAACLDSHLSTALHYVLVLMKLKTICAGFNPLPHYLLMHTLVNWFSLHGFQKDASSCEMLCGVQMLPPSQIR